MNVFSTSVPEATEKFLSACENAGAATERVAHPLTAPGDDPLESVIAWFGPRAASKVIAADVRCAPS